MPDDTGRTASGLDASPLGLDLACVIARLEQINSEQEPEHWLWDRVVTCDVPRLRRHLAALDDLAQIASPGPHRATPEHVCYRCEVPDES